ncbi:hypothetical protein AS589_16540 [Empedobacter brevis]|uniref:Uncharacterized protein n=1 Tax=Empedobacter brevis NBRC 14943 = ATCC 43319 TaxID=1218108 RepID=A0A511NHZ8_9FLAO|nr:hypothetical protein AS589_16540 [Empedobacter brevis]GEM52429.1 hypothetical protein EB1_22190 [Empedobacter brevis NBRC 14943 = ATCC 43319]
MLFVLFLFSITLLTVEQDDKKPVAKIAAKDRFKIVDFIKFNFKFQADMPISYQFSNLLEMFSTKDLKR